MDNDDFYIGWLTAPKHLVQFLFPVVGSMATIFLIGAMVLAAYQKHPGTGQWEDQRIVTLRGVVGTDPYATLWVSGENQNESVRAYLLVEDGKLGALPRVSRLLGDGRNKVPVDVRGTILHRDDRWMIALAADESGIRVLDADESTIAIGRLLEQRREPTEPVTLQGEIIDPKCYLGAMRPGGGKTHKACAMRCIAGGIPPMLVTRDPTMGETYYLLVDEHGGAANELVYPFVGDRVELAGRMEQAIGIRKLFISNHSMRRL